MRFRSRSPAPGGAGRASRLLPRPGLRRALALAGGAAVLAGVISGVAAAAVAAGSASPPSAGRGHGASAGPATAGTPDNLRGRAAGRPSASGSAGSDSAGRRSTASGAPSASKAGPAPAHRRPLTSCRSVAHIGDSTSVDLISSSFLPNAAQRLGARYSAVGVRHLRIDASGGRSIVEELPGQLNGYKVASAWRKHGYRGCWVFALGTNDAANVAAGSSVGMMARIDQMMAVAHGQPVLWVNTRTLLSAGPWANTNEQAWNKTLVRALAKYPNMRIFNWSAVVRPGWFLPDGIHYDTVGCAMRARAIADALARAFPLNGHSAGKIVR